MRNLKMQPESGWKYRPTGNDGFIISIKISASQQTWLISFSVVDNDWFRLALLHQLHSPVYLAVLAFDIADTRTWFRCVEYRLLVWRWVFVKAKGLGYMCVRGSTAGLLWQAISYKITAADCAESVQLKWRVGWQRCSMANYHSEICIFNVIARLSHIGPTLVSSMYYPVSLMADSEEA